MFYSFKAAFTLLCLKLTQNNVRDMHADNTLFREALQCFEMQIIPAWIIAINICVQNNVKQCYSLIALSVSHLSLLVVPEVAEVVVAEEVVAEVDEHLVAEDLDS